MLAAVEWLERAQDATGDGGVAGTYSLARGWTSSYPETTGYIIPTFLRLSPTFGARFEDRAARAVDFLLSVQLDSGAFPGGEIAENRTEPSVFNTAQIVTGLRAWHEFSGDDRVLRATERACDWLVRCQDADGAWRRHTYGAREYTYMAHAACWIAEMGEYVGEAKYLEAGRKHLAWVLDHLDRETGWFAKCGFWETDHAEGIAFTHNVAYTVWGVLLLGRTLGEQDAVDAAGVAALSVARRLELSGRLPGVLDRQWRGRAEYTCLTGNAQMALIWFELHRLSPNLPLVSAALEAIDAVKRAQRMRSSNGGIAGGVPGSDPIWGDYIRLALPNWAAKFYIDALLEKQALSASLTVPAPGSPNVSHDVPSAYTDAS